MEKSGRMIRLFPLNCRHIPSFLQDGYDQDFNSDSYVAGREASARELLTHWLKYYMKINIIDNRMSLSSDILWISVDRKEIIKKILRHSASSSGTSASGWTERASSGRIDRRVGRGTKGTANCDLSSTPTRTSTPPYAE